MPADTSCVHPSLPKPEFDLEAAKALTSAEDGGVSEIRKRWPRFEGFCPDCQTRVILYASTEHFLYGDW